MKNSRLIIFASLVLAGILLVQFNQMPNLDKQLVQAKADLKQAKLSQKSQRQSYLVLNYNNRQLVIALIKSLIL